MPSQAPSKPESAEQRFRAAFERLKSGAPERVPAGTPVSQNNVALEAGKDSTALRKSRFPRLILEIQKFVREQGAGEPVPVAAGARKRRETKRSTEQTLEDATRQRDALQSRLVSAEYAIVELTSEVAALRGALAKYEPPPIDFGRPK